ncbi:MAG: hypothetical protein OQK51_05430 [Kangiellaceae bacterium]|nr:hypothetical protein [Kangiellaceae bacterium]
MIFNKTPKQVIITFLCAALASLMSLEASANTNTAVNQNKGNGKDKIELKTLRIHGNKELPKVLFIVPWQDPKKEKGTTSKQRLVLHSLYGDLFDPITPSDIRIKKLSNVTTKD